MLRAGARPSPPAGRGRRPSTCRCPTRRSRSRRSRGRSGPVVDSSCRAPTRVGCGHDLRRRRRPLRLDALPPLRPQRPASARDLARPVAQLRRRPHARRPAGDRAARVRPGDHALRPGQQLRSAAGLGGGELRSHPGHRPGAVSRRADHLLQGGLRHVARAVRRMGLAQVRARLARPEPRADGARLRRHLLLPPLRSRHAARGDPGSARHRGAPGQGALRRHLLLLGRAHARGGGHPARARHAAADPPAVLLDAQPLDRARPARRAGRRRASAASCSRRSARGC